MVDCRRPLYQEVDGNDERAIDDDVVGDRRRDRLFVPNAELDVDRRLGGHDQSDRTLDDPKASPCALGDPMARPKRRRNAVLVEWSRGSDDVQAGGQLSPITEGAVQVRPDSSRPAILRQHPGTIPERGAVTNMLAVETGQVSHPVGVVILIEGVDPAKHP